MKRIWQYSTSLLFTALVTHQAFAQGSGPRSWKDYLPQSPARAVAAAANEEPTPATPPTAVAATKPALAAKQAVDAKSPKEASKLAATADEKSQNKAVGYYDQADETPPPAPSLLASQPTPAAGSASDKTPFMDEPMQPLGGACTSPGCTGDCGDPACNACDAGCGDCCESPVARNFARIEYLMWTGRGRAIPELVTSAFAPGPGAGVLGNPNTTVLYGGNDIGTDWRSGARLTVGRVLDENGEWMAVGRFLGLGNGSDQFRATSAAGDPILARPFFNTLLNQEDAFLVAYPGFSVNGSVDIVSRSTMMGAEAYLRHLILGEEDMTIDVLGGYQMSRVDDSLDIRNSSLILLDPRGIFAPNTTIAMRDQFRTRNEFHGGVFGLAIDSFRGPWKLEALGKVGIGNQRETVIIAGNTLITPAVGPAVNDPNGLLARQTNNGTFQRDVFTFVPELNLNLGYQINNWTFTVGYSFIYWNNVAFAGSQIDRSVNLSNPLVGAARPTFNFRDSDYWLQGVNIGAELAF